MPLISDLNLVFFAIVMFEGLSLGVTDTVTFAYELFLDFGKYSNIFDKDISEFLFIAVSKNISFAAYLNKRHLNVNYMQVHQKN